MLYTNPSTEQETPSVYQAPVWDAEPLPPLYSAHVVSGFGDGELETRAVIQVQMCLSRDELLTALMERHAMAQFDLDTLLPGEIRAEVEFWAAGTGDFELSRAAERFWWGYEDWTAEEKDTVAAMVRAIDRAYPRAHNSGIVLDGTPTRPTARCTRAGCDWTATGQPAELLMHHGLAHARLHAERETA